MTDELSRLKSFIGRSSPITIEVACAAPVARLAATLGIDAPASAPGEVLPVGWHGIYFGALHRPNNMRVDGQAAGGSWLPAVPLPRHRLGLDRAEFPGEIRIGDELKRVSRVLDISVTERAEGPVVSLVQRSEITGPRGLAVINERECIYYGGTAPPPSSPPVLPVPLWRKEIAPNPVLLFRYSAVRFNSHRVHYDREFALKEEGLPGLIVQASMIAQLLLEMCRTSLPERRIASFSPRTRHPVYDTGPFALCGAPTADGRSAMMWALDSAGSVALAGEIRFSG